MEFETGSVDRSEHAALRKICLTESQRETGWGIQCSENASCKKFAINPTGFEIEIY